MLWNEWLCVSPQGTLRMTAAGLHLWVFGLEKPLAQGRLSPPARAGGSWGRTSRSRNDGSGCIKIASLRKGSHLEIQNCLPQNHRILHACFKLLKEVSSRCKVAVLFNSKFLPFYSLQPICWTVILIFLKPFRLQKFLLPFGIGDASTRSLGETHLSCWCRACFKDLWGWPVLMAFLQKQKGEVFLKDACY